MRAMASARLSRLHRRLGSSSWRLETMSEGEIIAMSWACEFLSLIGIAEAAPDRILWLDFEAYLQHPKAGLEACLTRLKAVEINAASDAMLRSPDLTRYSKAPQYAYSEGLRREVLAQARREHPTEIARGLAWLQIAADSHPAIRDALLAVEAHA
jgi:hypothetical protein